MRGQLLLGILGAGLLGPASLPAQVSGLPVRNVGVPTGITVAIDLGFGQRIGSGAGSDQSSLAVGATATAGLGPLGVTGTIVRYSIKRPGGATTSDPALGVTAGFKFIGGPLIPLSVTLQAGASRDLATGYDASPGGGRPWRGLVGVGAALTIPAALLSVKPWLAPRLDYFGGSYSGSGRIHGAISGGVDLGFLNGLGIRVAYDSRLQFGAEAERATGVSVGVSYRL